MSDQVWYTFIKRGFVEVKKQRVVDPITRKNVQVWTADWTSNGKKQLEAVFHTKERCFKEALLTNIYVLYCLLTEKKEYLDGRGRVPLTFALGDPCLWVRPDKGVSQKVISPDRRSLIAKGSKMTAIGFPPPTSNTTVLSKYQVENWTYRWQKMQREKAFGIKKAAGSPTAKTWIEEDTELKKSSTFDQRKARIIDTARVCLEFYETFQLQSAAGKLYQVMLGEPKAIVDILQNPEILTK
eukprot:GHVH01005420.1.p1 GENE.GHVH01005420.1~~GHVH01005420.1.p1  ORF type:complete len:240 (-),score=20.52 GHVH01005420.1:57-776(-)